MTGLTFTHTRRVTYSECTVGNHIYYSRYLDLLEEARGEFFRQLGLPLVQLQAGDIIFPVIECHVRYLAPARYDDVLAIELWLAELGRVRLRFDCRIRDQSGTPILEASTQHVSTGLNEKPKRLPVEIVEKLQSYLRTEATD